MGNVLLKALPLLLLAAAACTTTRPATDPHPGQSGGRDLYERSCQRCHALYMPRSYTASDWKHFVRKYGRKARLTKAEQAAVYSYLSRNALVLAVEPNGP